MFSDATAGLIFGIGAGTWMYVKVLHNTGNNRSSLIAGGMAAVFGFLVILTLFKLLFHI